MKVTYKDVVIESTSTEEVLSMLKSLQRSKGEVVENKPKKVYYKRTSRGPRALWTTEEVDYIIKNINQPAGYVRKTFPYKTHTRNAIATMYYAIKSNDRRKFGELTAELMKQNNLV